MPSNFLVTYTPGRGKVTVRYPAGTYNHPATQSVVRRLARNGYTHVVGQSGNATHEYVLLSKAGHTEKGTP